MQPSAESHASSLRAMISFIAHDLGIDDSKDENPIAIVRKIRAKIAELKPYEPKTRYQFYHSCHVIGCHRGVAGEKNYCPDHQHLEGK